MRVLSFHASYACRHSGACCTARWPIPSRGGDALPMTAHGCVFRHDRRCSIHDAFGHDTLPVACQQFPRGSVTDPRGASVTLSCFCPTALAMLDEWQGDIQITSPIAHDTSPLTHGPSHMTHGPSPIAHHTSHMTPEGLDARTSLPPALCPDVLMDWESWWEFERLAVNECNRNAPLRDILARLSAIVEDVRTWKPGDGELIERVRASVRRADRADRADLKVRTYDTVYDSTDDRTTAPARERTSAPAHRRFLACHAFASWTAHLGAGLRTWLRSLETVVFLLENDWTIREIDEWLRHWADPRRLAAAWSAAET